MLLFKQKKGLIMKKLFGLLLLIASFSVLAKELDTPSYTIVITYYCEEGELSCNNVSYTGVNKKTGESFKLRGATWHTSCADTVTPCRFLGYKFKQGDVSYSISEEGRLEVVKGDKEVLVSEQGTWR
jgi:hypothetical protein